MRRVASNKTGLMTRKVKKSQVIEALLDIRTWLIFFINICLNVPNGGLIGFNSLIVKSLGFTIKETTLLAIPTGVISWVAALIVAALATRTRRPIACVCGAIVSE